MTAGVLTLVVAASALGMSVKSVTGVGYPLLAIPMLAPVIGIEDAVVVVSLPNAVANLLIVWQVRSARSETRDLAVLLTTEILGVACGALALVSWPEEPLLVILAAMIGVFVAANLSTNKMTISPRHGRRWSPLVGLSAGVAQGAVGVSGPIVVGWLYTYRLSREAFIFSVTALFLIGGFVQIGILAALGAYTADRIAAAVVAAVPVVVLAPIGERLRHRMSSITLDRAVLGLLVVAGLILIWRAVN